MNTEEIIEGYLGNIEVNSIYQGSELIWPKFKYMIGGNFTSPKDRIVRFNLDGTIDNTWYNNIDTGGWVYQLIYNNKKIYAAGESTLDGGLIRFNLDGTKDTSFNIGSGFSAGVKGNVRAINIDTINSKIYAGGNFTKFRDSTQLRLVRLNMNGSKDTSFNIGTGFDNTVNSIIIDNINSKIYVAGYFTMYNGSTQNGLVRLNLDGSKDTSFNIGGGFGGGVDSIKIDTINQKIYAGGNFTSFNGSTQNRLVRLNMNGTKDNTFNIGTGFDNEYHNAHVRAINIDTINQKIYVGGDFDEYNDGPQNNLIKLNMNGSRGTGFDIGTGFDGGTVTTVYDLDIDTINQKIYVGGSLGTFQGNAQNGLIRLHMDGSKDTSFNIGVSGISNKTVYTILKYT